MQLLQMEPDGFPGMFNPSQQKATKAHTLTNTPCFSLQASCHSARFGFYCSYTTYGGMCGGIQRLQGFTAWLESHFEGTLLCKDHLQGNINAAISGDVVSEMVADGNPCGEEMV